MLLQTFNLKENIRKYNFDFRKNISEDSTFGFDMFDTSVSNEINNMIDAINNCHTFYIFNDDEAEYNKSLQKALRTTRDNFYVKLGFVRAKGGIFKNMPYTDEQGKMFREKINEKEAWSNWLSDKWVFINESVQANTNLNATITDTISSQWNKHYLLARCNDTSLYRIASDILPYYIPALLKFIHESRKKLTSNRYQIPVQIYECFVKYLQKLEQEIQNLPSMIVESMLARLEAYDKSKGLYSNPIVYALNQLDPSTNTPKQPYQLSSDEFSFFHDYIEKHGNASHKKQLYKSSWFLGSNAISTTVVQTQNNEHIIVPNNLVNHVPLKQRWPSWLFGDITTHRYLFKQNGFLLASLIFQKRKPQYFIDLYYPQSCQRPLEEIERCESLVLGSLDKLTKPPYSTVSWYSFGTKALLRDWKKILEEQRMELINQKFDLAEKLINCLKSKAISPLDVPWKSYEVLLNLSHELEGLVQDQTIYKALQDRMYTINSTLSKYAPINKFYDILKRLSSGLLPEKAELEYLHRIIDSRTKTDPLFIEAFKRFNKPQLDLITDLLHSMLKNNLFNININELNNYVNLTTELYRVIEKTNTDLTSKALNKQMMKYFLYYLQDLYTHNRPNNSEHFKACKTIIADIGHKVRYLDKPLINHIIDLEKLQLDNPLLFKITCKSMILSVGSNLLTTRFDKELLQFDQEICNYLKNKDLSDEMISRLLKIRDNLINSNSVESLSLTSSDKKVLNIEVSTRESSIFKLLQCSAQAHKVKSTLHSNRKPLEKPMLIKHLCQSITKFLSECPDIRFAKTNEKWFAKQYVKENVQPSAENNSSYQI